MTQPLCGIDKISVKCVSFANTLYNIDSNNNTIRLVGSAVFHVEPGFYTPERLVSVINAAGIGISLTYVEDYNTLQWNIGQGVLNIPESSMSETLGIRANLSYTGTFTTQLFLASPMLIDFNCSQITPPYTTYSGRGTNRSLTNTQPFVTVPVTSGFKNMCTYLPPTDSIIQMGGGVSIAQLDMRITNPLNGRILDEIGPYVIKIECYR